MAKQFAVSETAMRECVHDVENILGTIDDLLPDEENWEGSGKFSDHGRALLHMVKILERLFPDVVAAYRAKQEKFWLRKKTATERAVATQSERR